MVKVLIANTTEDSGGAAKAANRLFRALGSELDVKYLVQVKESDATNVIGPDTKFEKLKSSMRSFSDQTIVRLKSKKIDRYFSYSGLPYTFLSNMVNSLNPDVLNLHWVQSGMLSISELSKIKCPIVWTMHDSWVFTGGCHLPLDCNRFEVGCGRCPAIGSHSEFDLSRRLIDLKLKHFNRRNDVFVSPSIWLAGKASHSKLLQSRKVHVIQNVIDRSIFKPLDRSFSRSVFGLPQNRKIVLFGARNAVKDVNKGFLELLEVSRHIYFENVTFVVYGASRPNSFNYGQNFIFLGEVKDERAMAVLFNAVDVVCVPSRTENLSYTIMESLSCGVPVLAFDVGGNSEMIQHQVNGFLARPFDVLDLAEGLSFLLSSNEKFEPYCLADDAVVKYKKLFQELMLHQENNENKFQIN
jgi:glycosyltransferase involved in cell wall biosynthesis